MKTYLFYAEIILVSMLLLGCAGNAKKEDTIGERNTTKLQQTEELSQSIQATDKSEEPTDIYMCFLQGDMTAVKDVAYTDDRADLKGNKDKEYRIICHMF